VGEDICALLYKGNNRVTPSGAFYRRRHKKKLQHAKILVLSEEESIELPFELYNQFVLMALIICSSIYINI
jgi:hypothetical protein